MGDDEEEEPKPGRRGLWSALALLAAIGYGFSLIHAGVENTDAQPAKATPTATSDATPTAPPLSVPGAAMVDGITGNASAVRSTPVHLTITSIGVDASVMPMTSSPPTSREAAEVGWNKNSVAPGEVGPAVFIGRSAVPSSKSAQTPAFRKLDEVRKGDRVTITRANHSTSDFVVDSVDVSTGTFPANRVYGDTGRPELRLVGFAGASTKSDAVIVYAHLT